MKAIVLAGGYATRLRPISYATPKLLFPVVGKPMIYWTLDMLRRFGVDEVVLCVNYLARQLRASVGDEYRGMRIEYSLEDIPLGTAGPIKLVSKRIRMKETFIAMNGDIITDINLSEMLNRHKEMKATITDALHEVMDPRRFGVVQLDSANRIRRFVEKPEAREAPSRLVNAGIYLIEPKVLRMILSGRKVSLEREIFPVLARQGRLGGFPFAGYWFDIGNMTDYQKANFALLERKTVQPIIREKGSVIATSASLKPPALIGKSSRIESKASIGPYVLMGKNGLIGSKARVSSSILFDEVKIGESSIVSGAILGSNVTLGKKVRIEPGSTISPNVRISDGVKIRSNVTIHPYKEISADIRAGTHVM